MLQLTINKKKYGIARSWKKRNRERNKGRHKTDRLVRDGKGEKEKVRNRHVEKKDIKRID